MSQTVSIRLLGRFEVRVDERLIPEHAWHRRSSAALVQLLALQPGFRVHREQAMDALWPDLLMTRATPRLHKAAHYARTALGARDAVVLSADGVALFPSANVTVDAAAFEAAAAQALSGSETTLPDRALTLYPGDLLPDEPYAEWAENARARLRTKYLRLLAEDGRWRQLVEADPTDERAHLMLVQELVSSGRRQAALRQLDEMATVLRRDLGTVPGAAAARLRAQALALPPEAADRVTLRRAVPVPPPPTRTVGRDADIARVVDLLGAARIVTLLGPGGAGKTRLAVEAAHRLLERTPVTGCFVDLSQVDSGERVAESICAELGLRADGAGGAERLLTETFRSHDVLLILDNFEHVADGADVVTRLVGAAPRLRALCTSRARLRIAGEHVFDVHPLGVDSSEQGDPPDAVALFEQAATAVDPAFRLADHRMDVEAICRAVDGLPLAIELAAGQLRTLPPASLRAQLTGRLASPAAAPRTSPARQRTMTATIDWSVRLLDEPERRLFARLSVFTGSVPIEAVQEVCGAGLDAVDALTRLVDQSLVQPVAGASGGRRFRLLRVLRERAATMLEGAEEVDVRDRHASYVADVLAGLDGWRQPAAHPFWVDRTTMALPDIRAAHGWAQRRGLRPIEARITATLGPYWLRVGHHAEGQAWVAAALPWIGELDPALAARLLLTAGCAEWPRDRLAARARFEAAALGFAAVGDSVFAACAEAWRAATFIGDPAAAAAAAACDKAIARARAHGATALTALALNIRGELDRTRGQDDAAHGAYREARKLAAAAGDDALLSLVLANLGYLAGHRGAHGEARGLIKDALRLAWEHGYRLQAGWFLCELAGPELALGDPARAARLTGAGEAALSALGATHYAGDAAELRRIKADVIAVLGDEAYRKEHAAGALLGLEDAVRRALEDDDERPARPAR